MRWMLLPLALSAGCDAGPIAEVSPEALTAVPSYAADVAPILSRACTSCHMDGAREGGVELHTYASAYSNRIRMACTAGSSDILGLDPEALVPASQQGQANAAACGPWAPLSMPPGARTRLGPREQLVLVRWVATGGRP